MTSYERLFWVHVAIATDVRATAQRISSRPTRCHNESWNLSLGWRPKQCRIYKDEHTWHLVKVEVVLLLPYRQNVVIVGAGRISRSARIATSSELLYLLNLLYNMPSECCDEYKLIQLYQKSSVWCFAFSHTSTFELIPAVAMAQPGAMVTNPLNSK